MTKKIGRVAGKTALIAGLLGSAGLLIGANGNWNTTVERTDRGHLIGNPQAKVKLTEFISYTCPHCATFAVEGEAPLQIGYIGPGKVSLDVRHSLHDPVDLTAAMLANCGPAAKFPQNHAALMRSQSKWLPTLTNRSPAQVQRWSTGDNATRRRNIAADFGFYKLMQGRGYSRPDADRCLNDEALAKRLSDNTVADIEQFGVRGTPSFALNGVLLAGTHDWATLAPQLDARLKPAK